MGGNGAHDRTTVVMRVEELEKELEHNYIHVYATYLVSFTQ